MSNGGSTMIILTLTKQDRDEFSYIPENEYFDAAENGRKPKPVKFDDLMEIANGDKKVAFLLYNQCSGYDAWAYPETYHEENIELEEYFENEDGTYTINPEYDFKLIWEE